MPFSKKTVKTTVLFKKVKNSKKTKMSQSNDGGGNITTTNIPGKVDVYLGLQWGDEGKGKEIDEALPKYDCVARFQGADNAGHTYKHNGDTIIGHLMPSGALYEHIDLMIGNGVVVNPVSLMKEYVDLKSKGIDTASRLFISERAKLVTYLHPFLDAAEEYRMGKTCVGSTLRGVGPAYKDFKGRHILLMGDILNDNFQQKIESFLDFQFATLYMYEAEWKYKIPFDQIEGKKAEWLGAVEQIKKFQICDTSDILRKKLADGKRILAEGAQGAMLDNDYGDYPYTTSSNTLTASACLGLGFPHQFLGDVYGVIKAYTTKVGGGAFPSRIKDEEIEKLYQEKGQEFGATTGRRRMCGWIDLVALKRAIYLSGVTKVCINKSDICPIEEISIVTAYLDKDGNKMERFPLHLEDVAGTEELKFAGWEQEDTFNARHWEDLPVELITYINYLSDEIAPLGAKIVTIGTGPERGQNVQW